MTRLRATLMLVLLGAAAPLLAQEQESLRVNVDPLTPESRFWIKEDTYVCSNRTMVTVEETSLIADTIRVDAKSGEALADGDVRIQRGEQIWAADHIQYNFRTGQMVAPQFRTGKAPIFAGGKRLQGDVTNQVYNAAGAYITVDDIADPAMKIRARRIRIIPGKRIEAWDAVLMLDGVPVFYFPYYSRNLGERANNFSFIPGYRSAFGPFVLGSYTWFLNEKLDGTLHADYRQKRGFGGGPDLDYHFGRWGEGVFRYYYTHDDNPSTNALNAPVRENRQRISFSYQANPFTNFNVKSLVRYQNDAGVVKDFFPGEYRQNPQPDTFVEANKAWQNFSLDVLTRPRVNEFYETVERLPDVRLTGFRQQIGHSPLYYESESTFGYYRRLFAETNGPVPPQFEAARADTYHQLLLPQTFFGWLNVVPRAGGRFTWYSRTDGPAATNEEAYRRVFNTGAEVSFKASRLWPAAQCAWLELDGLRHIVEPSLNYVYVPKPNDRPGALPQFDYESPSLRLLPLDFPEYNAIDSVDSQNVIRFGLQNKLQTKRADGVQDLLNWEVFADWRLRPRSDQRTFGDLYSDLTLRPRSWLTLQSQLRYNLSDENWRMSLNTLTFQPNNVWSWTIGHFYLRDDFSSSPTALGQGNNLITSGFFYRLDENWGFRATHHFNARDGRLQEQYYSIYRDLRSWTAAVTAGLRDNGTGSKDFTIAFTFSLKAMPKFGVGGDTVRPYSLLGG